LRFGRIACPGLALLTAALGLMADRAAGQVPALAAIDPPGALVGQTTECRLTGTALADVDRFLVSGDGIQVVAVGPATETSIGLRVSVMPGAVPSFRALRAVAAAGISNLMLFRLDTLPQSSESEPNDEPARANAVALPAAVAGVLQAQDIDHFVFSGRSGQRVTMEVEARRLGSAVVPVLRLFAPSGASLLQSQPLRDGTGDCRLSIVLPADGRYGVELRDAIYAGGATARYRLRFDTGAYATGLFPLGGRGGTTVEVAASGGTLAKPLRKPIALPEEPGAIVEPGVFDGPEGPLLAPGRLVIGEGPEIIARLAGDSQSPSLLTQLPPGTTANGLIDRPGAVDRYAVPAHAGDRLLVDVQAAALGSWLDPVITLFDTEGQQIAENDDRGARAASPGGSPLARLDSRLEAVVPAGGVLIVAITDRFGEGGTEYAYRLTVGPPRPDINVTLRLGAGPLASGALNLRPGTSVSLPFQVAAVGNPPLISVRAEGLPPGVVAAPTTLRLPRPTAPDDVASGEGILELSVEPGTRPTLGALRVVATARDAEGRLVTRRGSAGLQLTPVLPGDPRPPPTLVVTELPVLILKSE
jgi:hypothetical protein